MDIKREDILSWFASLTTGEQINLIRQAMKAQRQIQKEIARIITPPTPQPAMN